MILRLEILLDDDAADMAAVILIRLREIVPKDVPVVVSLVGEDEDG